MGYGLTAERPYSEFTTTFRPPRLVRRRIFHLNIINLKHRSRFIQINNFHKKPKNKLTKPLIQPTLSNYKNELNLTFLNTKSLNNKSLQIFNFQTLSSIDFLSLIETWRENATSPSLLSASPSSYFS